jgi:AcrR family transcriptional regulator
MCLGYQATGLDDFMSDERRGRPLDAQRDKVIHTSTLSLMGEYGYDALSVERVAKLAGVSKATIYRRYPNKMELVLASLDHNLYGLPMPDSGSGLDDLQQMAHMIRTYGLNNETRCMFGTMMTARVRHPELAKAVHERIVVPRRQRARSVLERAIKRGELPAETPLELVMDMVFGAMLVRLARGEEMSESLAKHLVKTVWFGMGGR